MGQTGEHRPKGLKKVVGLRRKGPQRRRRSPQPGPTADMQLVSGLHVHLVAALHPVLLPDGGRCLTHIQGRPGRLVEAARDPLQQQYPLMPGQGPVPDCLDPVKVHPVGVPVLKVHGDCLLDIT